MISVKTLGWPSMVDIDWYLVGIGPVTGPQFYTLINWGLFVCLHSNNHLSTDEQDYDDDLIEGMELGLPSDGMQHELLSLNHH